MITTAAISHAITYILEQIFFQMATFYFHTFPLVLLKDTEQYISFFDLYSSNKQMETPPPSFALNIIIHVPAKILFLFIFLYYHINTYGKMPDKSFLHSLLLWFYLHDDGLEMIDTNILILILKMVGSFIKVYSSEISWGLLIIIHLCTLYNHIHTISSSVKSII